MVADGKFSFPQRLALVYFALLRGGSFARFSLFDRFMRAARLNGQEQLIPYRPLAILSIGAIHGGN